MISDPVLIEETTPFLSNEEGEIDGEIRMAYYCVFLTVFILFFIFE